MKHSYLQPQIIIPMSGFGQRFARKGYTLPKPLIEVEGKPIIAHVIDLFTTTSPQKTDIFFICNQEHLDNPDYQMQEKLQHYAPADKFNVTIIGIAPHKLGPVYAVQQIQDKIDMNRPTIVNYCDFTCYWDYDYFRRFISETQCDGAIPAYKGFHPHTLGTTNYAYMREQNGLVLDIQEKQPYTDNRMEEYASSGCYYFASATIMYDAFAKMTQQNLQINGEYYVSLAYKPLLADNKQINVYPLQHFMQWGTPEDVAEYNGWSDIFHHYCKPPQAKQTTGSIIIPMAGLGQRFAKEGYQTTKPLIDVSTKPMVTQAVNDLPPAKHHHFILRADMAGCDDIQHLLRNNYQQSSMTVIPEVTEGQAITALIGLEALLAQQPNAEPPFTFGACDNGMIYDHDDFEKLCNDDNIDILVWAASGHSNAIRQPQMFGWIDADDKGLINNISVKTPLSSPETDPIVIGCFTFKRADDFKNCVQNLLKRDGRINGEFYLDSCINDAIAIGLKCHVMKVKHFISWGTPNDLRSFNYWQSCFDKWQTHPYRLEKDARITPEKISALRDDCPTMIPPIPQKI
ncbi:MAG: NTP transferase domain-containing protein [Alphaproteobacteria bacterium]|nr:NTP transferase domain-containing protein [Alphaproteobacteria bacterium]